MQVRTKDRVLSGPFGSALPAGPPHRIGDILAHDACWAPDGLHLVYLNGKDLFVARPDGSEIGKLATADGFIDSIRF